MLVTLAQSLLLFMPLALAFPQNIFSRADPFVWGALGDSWASGVSYNIFGHTDYDGNKNECLRLNHAYAPKLNGNNTWIPEGRKGEFHFAACSGSAFKHIVGEKFNKNPIQMDLVGTPSFLTMQIGGNDVGFYSVASKCIFHDNWSHDHGPEFPDDKGECKQAIDAASTYIGTNLYNDYQKVVRDVLAHGGVYGNMDFRRLYVLGYAHFFDIRRPDTNWCNKITFALPWSVGIKPMLTIDLRIAINNLVEEMNQQIHMAVQDLHDDRVRFVDISPAFDGHRFCQVGHNWCDQYRGEDPVWLWNASPTGVLTQGSDGKYDQESPPTCDDIRRWIDTGKLTKDTNELGWNFGYSGGSPSQGGLPGFQLRPFHPKEKGHAAIMETIINAMNADGQIIPPRPSRQ